MKLNIPFEDLNKFRISASTPLCDAVLSYCEHNGIESVEYYNQITRPVCEFVARSIGVDPNIIVEWEDAENYPDLSVLVEYAPYFMNNDGFNREKYINLMIERHEHLIIDLPPGTRATIDPSQQTERRREYRNRRSDGFPSNSYDSKGYLK